VEIQGFLKQHRKSENFTELFRLLGTHVLKRASPEDIARIAEGAFK